MFAIGKVRPSDKGDWNLESARDLLEEIRDKLYAQCGDSDPDPLKVELCGNLNNLLLALDSFQIKDCDGTNIGPIQQALKTLVLNKVITKICNVEELATAIATAIGNLNNTGSAALYNTPGYVMVEPGNNYVVASGTVHSLSYKIIGGDGTLQVGAGAAIPIISGESDGWEASTTLNQSFTFSATSGTIKVVFTKQ